MRKGTRWLCGWIFFSLVTLNSLPGSLRAYAADLFPIALSSCLTNQYFSTPGYPYPSYLPSVLTISSGNVTTGGSLCPAPWTTFQNNTNSLAVIEGFIAQPPPLPPVGQNITLPTGVIRSSLYNFVVNWLPTGGRDVILPIVDDNGQLAVAPVVGFASFHIASVQPATFSITGYLTPPVAGACGSSNGGTFAGAPAAGLCSSGVAPPLSGAGPWNWSCLGLNGGASVSCAAAAADTIGPTLTISTLADGAVTSNATLNIAGTADDDDGVAAVTINNVSVPLAADGTFSAATSLVPGKNIITTVAVDSFGNQSKDVRTITLDQTAPVLTVTAPADNGITGQQTITVSGTVDETSTVFVTVNAEVPQQAALTGTAFTRDVTLAPGINTINITATDAAANSTSVKRTVTFDNANPSLTVTDPPQDITISQNTITLSGTASDPFSSVTLSVAVDGLAFAPALTQGAFSQQLTFSVEGTHAVAVTASDEVGNSTTVIRNVIYTIPKPQVTIDSATAPTSSASGMIGGTMDAGSVVTVTAPTATVGPVTYPTETTWQATLAGLATGTNSFTAIATNAAGKVSDPAFVSISVPPPVPTGDLNSSGQVELADVMRAYLAVLGRVQLTGPEKYNADVAPLGPDGKPSGNGTLDIADIVLLLRHLIGVANW